MIPIAQPLIGDEEKQAVLKVISLPVHPALSSTDLETIVAAVNDLCS